jgi:hypothetical protein
MECLSKLPEGSQQTRAEDRLNYRACGTSSGFLSPLAINSCVVPFLRGSSIYLFSFGGDCH